MEGVIFLLSVIAVGVIMWWVIENDAVGPTEPTRGLLAMDDTPSDKAAQAAKQSTGERRPGHDQGPQRGVIRRLPPS